MTKLQGASPQDYRLIFEQNPVGVAILEDLCRLFSKPPVLEGGIDAILKTFNNAGERKPIEYIALMINRANNVPDINAEGITVKEK